MVTVVVGVSATYTVFLKIFENALARIMPPPGSQIRVWMLGGKLLL